MRSSRSFSIGTVFSALILFFIAGMPIIASAASIAPGTTLSADNLTLSVEMFLPADLGGCHFSVNVVNNGPVAYPLDNCTITVSDGAGEYSSAAAGIVLPLNMAAKNIPLDYNGAMIMRDSQWQAIHTPLVVTLTDGRGKLVAIASLKEGANLRIDREKDTYGYGATPEAWYSTHVDPTKTISDVNLSVGAQQVLYASLGGSSVNILIYNSGEVAYPLDGCTATVSTKTGEYTVPLSGTVLPLGIVPKVVRVNYDACIMSSCGGSGSCCASVYGPTAVLIGNAEGHAIAMASLQKGVNLEEFKMPHGSSDSDHYAAVVYG